MQPDFSKTKHYGSDLEKAEHERLTGAVARVYAVMQDSVRRTTEEIGILAQCPAASAHRHLSTLRTQFGYAVVKERVTDTGLWEYWIAGGGMGVHTRNPKKMTPVGDSVKFGKMMQAIYAFARTPDAELQADPGHDAHIAVFNTTQAWAKDMAERIKNADK